MQAWAVTIFSLSLVAGLDWDTFDANYTHFSPSFPLYSSFFSLSLPSVGL
jgi:hypothetical protein